MRRRIVALIVALVLLVVPISPAFALTSQDVTVTATPEYIAIANAPGTWTLNGITGSGVILVNTTYYSNPLGDTTVPAGANVVDAECRFDITNTSTIAIDLTLVCANFAGGDANMNNSDGGGNGATDYGAYSWFSGDAHPGGRVIIKTAGSAVGKNALAAMTDIKWGAEILTQTNAWTGGGASTATMTITATAD